MGGACSTQRRDEKCIQILVVNYEGKRPLVRPWCRWENNFRMDLREISWESVDWIRVA
jgi:hypothetical protein